MSYLTQSESELWDAVVAGLEGEGFPFNRKTTSRSKYLATALGQPNAYRTKSFARLLAELNTSYGGSLSYLTSSIAHLLGDLDTNIAAGGGASAPINTVAPAVTGNAYVGSTLTASTGTWSGDTPISYAYQWKSGGSNVGTDQNTYVPVTGDIGNTITCTVTATNVGGSGTPTASAATASVIGAPVNTVLPVITGTATSGQTLSTSNGTWTGGGSLSYAYQWKADASNIGGATASTFLLTDAQGGKVITVAVTATNAAGSTAATSSGTSAVAIVPTTGKLVANRTQMATGTATITAPFTSRRSHWAHPDGDITDIKCFDSNRFILSTTAASGGGSHSRRKYIEYPVDVFHQVKWAGAASIALTASSRVVSDVVVSSVTGLALVIPAGAKFWERTVVSVGSSIAVPVFITPAACDVLGLDDGNSASDLGNSGTIAPTTGANTLGSQGFIGTVNATNARSFVVVGDSLTFGQGDITGVGAKGGSGWVARMLDAHGYPYMKWAFGGQQAKEQAALIASINADLAQIGFTDFVLQSGLNDLRLSRTGTEIKADYQTIYGMSNVVGKRILQGTLGPRSTSTDGWATTANQAPQTDGNMAGLTQLNADIRAGLANVTGVIEAADAAMSARNSNIHKAPPAGTTDGTHFDSTRAALVAGLLEMDIAL